MPASSGMVWDGGVSMENFPIQPKSAPPGSTTESPLGSPHMFSLGDDEFFQEEYIRHRLAGQIDYLFSDGSLWTDEDLKHEIAANDDGWVSIGWITRLPKIMQYTRDREVICKAVSLSHFLQVDEKGTMIRRLNKYDPENNPRRHAKKSMYVDNLPEELCDEESVRQLFTHFGEIATVKPCQVWMPFDAADSSVARDISLCDTTRKRRQDIAFVVDFEDKSHSKLAVTAVSSFNKRNQAEQPMSSPYMMAFGRTRIDSLASDFPTPALGPNGEFKNIDASPIALGQEMDRKTAASVANFRLNASPKESPISRGSYGPSRNSSGKSDGDEGSSRSMLASSAPRQIPGDSGDDLGDKSQQLEEPKKKFQLSAKSPIFTPLAERMSDGPVHDRAHNSPNWGDQTSNASDDEIHDLPDDFAGLYVMTKFSYMKRMERMYMVGGTQPHPSPKTRSPGSVNSVRASMQSISLSPHMSPASGPMGAGFRHSLVPLPTAAVNRALHSRRTTTRRRRSESGNGEGGVPVAGRDSPHRQPVVPTRQSPSIPAMAERDVKEFRAAQQKMRSPSRSPMLKSAGSGTSPAMHGRTSPALHGRPSPGLHGHPSPGLHGRDRPGSQGKPRDFANGSHGNNGANKNGNKGNNKAANNKQNSDKHPVHSAGAFGVLADDEGSGSPTQKHPKKKPVGERDANNKNPRKKSSAGEKDGSARKNNVMRSPEHTGKEGGTPNLGPKRRPSDTSGNWRFSPATGPVAQTASPGGLKLNSGGSPPQGNNANSNSRKGGSRVRAGSLEAQQAQRQAGANPGPSALSMMREMRQQSEEVVEAQDNENSKTSKGKRAARKQSSGGKTNAAAEASAAAPASGAGPGRRRSSSTSQRFARGPDAANADKAPQGFGVVGFGRGRGKPATETD